MRLLTRDQDGIPFYMLVPWDVICYYSTSYTTICSICKGCTLMDISITSMCHLIKIQHIKIKAVLQTCDPLQKSTGGSLLLVFYSL